MTSTEPNRISTPARPRVDGAGPAARPERFRDDLIRPFLTVTAIAVTIVQLSSRQIIWPPLAVPMFIVVSLFAIGVLFSLARLPQWQQVAVITGYMVLSALLLPLLHSTDTASLIPYVAASTAGVKLDSRRAAIGIAVLGALIATGSSWGVEHLAPTSDQWPWWVPLTIALPVYVGMSAKDRSDALASAHRAADAAQRAAESEAREAALEERGRIAREIHDVLGHSLSGIALQLDMADALRGSGREEEAVAAVRRARSLAVDSISETRRAVHALREDTLPLPDTLRRMADNDGVSFQIVGEPGPVGVEATHTVVRAAQESLTNAAKYAPGASRAMTLTFTEDILRLTVANGPATLPRRFDLAGGTGLGLVGMRERVALLGGTVAAGPDPAAHGWTVELEVPRWPGRPG